MNDYRQNVTNQNIEVFIGDMVNARNIYFEIKNNFVDTDVVFKIKVDYQTIDGENRNIAVSRKLAVVDSKEKLQDFPKNESIIENVLALVKHRTFRETSDLYEKGRSAEVRGMFADSIDYVQNLSASYCLNANASSAVMGTLDALTNLNTTYASNNVSKSFTKKLYAQSARSLK